LFRVKHCASARTARWRAVLNCVACFLLIHTFVSVAGRAAVRRCTWLDKYIAMRLFQSLDASPFAPRIFTSANVPWLLTYLTQSNCCRWGCPCVMSSHSLPGVATTTSGPDFSTLSCFTDAMPPTIVATLIPEQILAYYHIGSR
jgi:hypothetical protein